tara:strand:- start:110 stop:886 length:777 start_codon:yes stop_codon:yes gene_type:complete
VSVAELLMRFVASAIFVAVLSSCAPGSLYSGGKPYAQEGLEVPALADLCETRGGLHVYQTVPDAKGFVKMPLRSFDNGENGPVTDQDRGGCGNCLDYLARDGFEFVEAEFTAPRYRSDNNDYAPQSGLYRYALVPRESGLCERHDLLVRFVPPVRLSAEKYADVIGDRCVHAQPISAFTARYQYERNLIIGMAASYQGESGFISQTQEVIRDRANAEPLVEANAFRYVNPNFANRFLGSCHYGHWMEPGTALRTSERK